MSKEKTENALWSIRKYLMHKHGCDMAEYDIQALEWYIDTGRASVDFLKAFHSAKPFMIGRLLHKGGSYDEIISRVKKYIGVENSRE